ncbi:MAG: 30S ribosomal protein S20 [Clostridiales bacterium]|nr:MAG: 30S ribosomal protein S20 [Clostridiales bacterium]
MANIKSAKKRILTINKRTMINKSRKSAMKTSIKKVYDAIEKGDKNLATEALKEASKIINVTASKGTIHKNKAARLVSRLQYRVNNIA